MPNRIIKESICVSESIDKLSWFEEVVFYRLIVNCDDAGRFDGRPAVIKSRLFPLKENITVKAVDAAIRKLASAELVTLYVFEGKPYLYLPSWGEHQRLDRAKPKYPDPTSENTPPPQTAAVRGSSPQSAASCGGLRQTAADCGLNPNTNTNTNQNTNNNPNSASESDDTVLPPDLDRAVKGWLDYKRQRNEKYNPAGLTTLLKRVVDYASEYGETAVISAIEDSMASGYQGIVWDKIKRSSQKTSHGQTNRLAWIDEVNNELR